VTIADDEEGQDLTFLLHAPRDIKVLLEETWRLDQIRKLGEAMAVDKIAELNSRVEDLEGQLAAIDGWSARIVGGEVEIRRDGDDRRLSGWDLPLGAVLAFIADADAEEVIGPDTLCPCGKTNDGTGSGYCSGEHFEKYDGGSDEH